MKIRMLRNVLVEGKHCNEGDVVEVGDELGARLIQWHRAEAADAGEETADDGPQTTDGEETTDDGPQTAAGEETTIETATRPAAKRRRRGEL